MTDEDKSTKIKQETMKQKKKMVCFIPTTVQNIKIYTSLFHMTKKNSKSSHDRS